jgi:hypothetical protein
MAKKGKRRCDTLPILHPDAAGIDVGASELYVAVSADGSVPSQRTAREERAGPEDRRLGLPVASVSAFCGSAARQLPATRIHLRHTVPLATSQQPDSNGSRARLARAEGFGPNEPSDSSRS